MAMRTQFHAAAGGEPAARGRCALQIIRDEHSSISAVLSSLLQMIERGPGDHPEQFFDVMRAMLFYIDEFPEKQHHPKESNLLFPMLWRRAPELAGVIGDLERDHAGGPGAVRELQHRLLAWELLGDGRRAEFEDALRSYVTGYVQHMRVEEKQLLDVAERVLEPAEKAELDAAFQANRDPLGPDGARPAFERLFTRIVMRAPAPVGVGPG